MTTIKDYQAFLDTATISPDVIELRPDYRALLLIVSGIKPGASDSISEAALAAAEEAARAKCTAQPLTEQPHIAAWREAFKAFGVKPKQAKSSVEALSSRVDAGLPRINRLTDMYNAVSVKYQIPLGGEDLDKYGEPVVEHPKQGEVVWADDGGVTCRRWNWRQCHRTALTESTEHALFIFDALDPITNEQLNDAGTELIELIKQAAPDVVVARRVLGANATE